jgi:Transcriptional Coactivator p15 (PC4)
MLSMTRKSSLLQEPVVVSEWWKNRSGESIRVRLSTYEGRDLIDVRTFYTAQDGILKPGKGFCAEIKHLPKLAKALADAYEKAHDLGLLLDMDGPHD